MLLDSRLTYKPLSYPWAFDYYRKHEAMHWTAPEVALSTDVEHWNNKLTDKQKDFLTQIFRFFTQGDVCVADGYATKFIPLFHGNPEIAMMMLSFGAREACHIDAYSLLIDTVGMPESEYSAFLDFKAMKDKYDYVAGLELNDNVDIAKAVAVYSAFTEGMQLFSSFAMLMHFERIGKLPGMTQVVRWSLRDEAIHAEAMIKVFRTFVSEYMNNDLKSLEPYIHEVAEKMVELEDAFIDLAFSVVGEDINLGLVESNPLTPEVVKEYIRHTADFRLQQLGMSTLYGGRPNPIPWLSFMLQSPEHTNFFENKSTEYSRVTQTGEDFF